VECLPNETTHKKCLGALEDLPELTLQHNISDIVVTTEGISKHDLIEILDFCTSAGINAWFSPNLMPIIDIKLHIDRFCGKPMVRLCSQKRSALFYKLKHTSDAFITLPLFLLQLPLFILIMAAIKWESQGPVFYVARAIGKGGKPFNMLKFRSMFTDSDKSVHQAYVTKLIKGEIREDDKKNGPLKIVQDPRVTKVGRILRKLSLDELPQLINVLKGQMSLVGPRPCLPYEYDIYQDWHKKRTAVRPGITGLWQVTGRSEVLFEDMILLDLYYIYNNSVILELQILFETVFVVLGKKGAY
jgi:undecaprenyl-phosphate galactose phosphotransferase